MLAYFMQRWVQKSTCNPISGKKRRRSRSRDSSYGEEDRKRRRKDHRYFSRSSVTSDRDNGELARRSSPRCSQNSQNSQSRSRSREGSHLENKSFSEKDRESVEYRPREMPRSSQVSKSDKGTNNELKDSILALLGEDPAKNTCVGPQIHRAIADRWTDILQNGLPKDKKEEILKKYSPAENCSMLQAPKLGPHVQSTMSTISIKRDAYQMLAQNQLGKGISVLGTVLTEMVNLKDEKEDQGQIALFSDAARILTDLYHTMSTSRKYFIMSGFNSAEKVNQEVSIAVINNKPSKNCHRSFKLPGPLQEDSVQQESTGGHGQGQIELSPIQQPADATLSEGISHEPFPGGREVIRRAFAAKGIPKDAQEITLASLADATLKQYEKPIRNWWEFCRDHQLHIFDATESKIIEFLTSNFQEDASYGTLNNYRAAISLIVKADITNNLEIKRFFRGVSNLKPQKPRYDYIWDPSPVLKFISSLGSNDKLDQKQLTKKLVTLLALVTAQRVQTLSKIDINNIIETEKYIQITVPERIKTSGINKMQPLLNIPFFEKDALLCVGQTLKDYLKLTETIRPRGEKRMFISFKKPHRAACSQTISRWIKETLEEAGIDTQVFTSHSTRHASTSAALRSGVNVEEIRKAAGWTPSSEVFARFYNCPLKDPTQFATSILNT
ncbi:uncharacterized protein LOC122500503 [Leptopilina heterotoma]|uniref:uncharacterized protein LOC122500503 n=1 Tax=Leptopilina heterotoma TaxID=63436 RepID=UPI001CA81713|nr:uncharacterized protein LOC122500503 [Leptopilina heterotoma]